VKYESNPRLFWIIAQATGKPFSVLTRSAAWQARHNIVIDKFPGFISSDVIPPSQPESNEWTIILNFRSQDELTAWQRSGERAKIVGEAIPLFEGGSLGEVAQPDRPGEPPGSNVTEVIISKIKPGMDDTYREWAVRIQAAQAKYLGYRGMYLQLPIEKDGLWTTIMRFRHRRAPRSLDGGPGACGTARGLQGLHRP
jgi:antibiotic biosynthesis monooxygenase (ABM) superfamily enzyme